MPITNHVRFDLKMEHVMCHELDDGFGWDATWYEKCKSSFEMLSIGAVWSGSVMMIAQWWALVEVLSWNVDMKKRETKWDSTEKGGKVNEKDLA